MANKKKIPVLLTSHFCGTCPEDHKDFNMRKEMLMNMTLKERKAYFKHPLHSSREHILAVWRVAPWRAPLTAFGRMINLYFPKFYYGLSSIAR